MKASVNGADPQPFTEMMGGSHVSFSPDRSRIMDVVGHKVLWVSPLGGGNPKEPTNFPIPMSGSILGVVAGWRIGDVRPLPPPGRRYLGYERDGVARRAAMWRERALKALFRLAFIP